jgi:phosphoglycolate phosphatase
VSQATRFENILFDFDGTLADPLDAFSASAWEAFDTLGLPRPPLALLRQCIGPPLHESIPRILGVTEPALAARVLEEFRKHHVRESVRRYRFYEGAREMLAALRSRPLFVATSKPRVLAEPIFRHHGFLHFFRALHGSELDGTRAHKGELIAYALEREKLDPRSTVMVGDRHFDIAGARANGLATVGVLWGYGTEAELREAGADRLAKAPAELVTLLS